LRLPVLLRPVPGSLRHAASSRIIPCATKEEIKAKEEEQQVEAMKAEAASEAGLLDSPTAANAFKVAVVVVFTAVSIFIANLGSPVLRNILGIFTFNSTT